MRFSSVPIIADMLEAKLVNAPFKDTIKFYFLILKLWKEISKIRSIFFHRCLSLRFLHFYKVSRNWGIYNYCDKLFLGSLIFSKAEFYYLDARLMFASIQKS